MTILLLIWLLAIIPCYLICKFIHRLDIHGNPNMMPWTVGARCWWLLISLIPLVNLLFATASLFTLGLVLLWHVFDTDFMNKEAKW